MLFYELTVLPHQNLVICLFLVMVCYNNNNNNNNNNKRIEYKKIATGKAGRKKKQTFHRVN